MTSDLLAEGLERSLSLLLRSARPWGFAASSDLEHYDVLWVRDAAVAILGAAPSGDSRLVEASWRCLTSIAESTPRSGHVPAVIWDDGRGRDWGEGGVIDTAAWFVIACEAMAQTDPERVATLWPTARGALNWLASRDVTGTGLISAAPATDWMDSSLTRSGRTLHLNVLYAWASAAANRLSGAIGGQELPASMIARKTNILFWPEPTEDLLTLHPDGFHHTAILEQHRRLASSPRRHYVSHVVHSAFVDRCDVLANLLAIVGDVAGDERGREVLSFLDEKRVDEPYPTKSWPQPVDSDDSMIEGRIELSLDHRWHNPPHRYHNGGSWPYIGAFHAAASAKVGDTDASRRLLFDTARANAVGDWRFSEWLDGSTGDPAGASSQTWNAGAFVYAYHLLGLTTDA